MAGSRIVGAPLWADRSTYYTQINNPTEEILRKTGNLGWLESCGPESSVNCMASRGVDLVVKTPGGATIQPGEIITDWLNDPANYPELLKIRSDVDPSTTPGNRVPQYYPRAVNRLFGESAIYAIVDIARIVDFLLNGNPVQVCLQDPGHYIAVVAFDQATNEIIYRDPWPGNSWPVRLKGTDGFNRRVTPDELAANRKNFAIIYGL